MFLGVVFRYFRNYLFLSDYLDYPDKKNYLYLIICFSNYPDKPQDYERVSEGRC